MASALVELPRLVPGFDRNVSDYKEAFLTGPHAYKPDAETKGTETQPPAAFPNYLPTWDTEKKYTPLQPFTCYEHGKDADPTFPNLLKDAKVTDLTANIGAEIHGIQLSKDFFEERTNFVTWHSDVTYEEQPSGTTFLYLLDGPTAGGDTLFGSQTEAYKRLSPEFRKRLHGLKAVHTETTRDTYMDSGTRRESPLCQSAVLV
ncbi:hypothetical protein H2201_000082 [Coniosporium apollinis]|uniref:TauD/TfdA-like domain-containing protein n=1 Tax=Coniosporium apollinis TaxID=61459 RepID=A0ABQ9PA01_9PEZI|nr:hypothetical protein H2201_000082 [Coniosporium apollinis]